MGHLHFPIGGRGVSRHSQPDFGYRFSYPKVPAQNRTQEKEPTGHILESGQAIVSERLPGNADFVQLPTKYGEIPRSGPHYVNAYTDPAFKVYADPYKDSRGKWRYKVNNLRVWAWIVVNKNNRYNHIPEFKPYYDANAPYSDKFNTAEGVLVHERQHLKEYEAAYNKLQPGFVRDVHKIQAKSRSELDRLAQSVFSKFKRDFHTMVRGEEGAQAAEWAYYFAEYEKHLGGEAEK